MATTAKKTNKAQPASTWEDDFNGLLEEQGESLYLTSAEMTWVAFAKQLGAAPEAVVETLLAAR
jgi:hypothetical protein